MSRRDGKSEKPYSSSRLPRIAAEEAPRSARPPGRAGRSELPARRRRRPVRAARRTAGRRRRWARRSRRRAAPPRRRPARAPARAASGRGRRRRRVRRRGAAPPGPPPPPTVPVAPSTSMPSPSRDGARHANGSSRRARLYPAPPQPRGRRRPAPRRRPLPAPPARPSRRSGQPEPAAERPDDPASRLAPHALAAGNVWKSWMAAVELPQ